MNKYEKVAESLLPAGVIASYRKSYTGRAYYGRNGVPDKIASPAPRGAKSLQIYLHEIAHITLHHPRVPGNSNKPTYVKEYEAEQWAISAMRENGLTVSNKLMALCKRHVEWKLYQALRRGLRNPDWAIVRWCEIDTTHVRYYEARNNGLITHRARPAKSKKPVRSALADYESSLSEYERSVERNLA